MKQQHHPYEASLFSKGANYDINKEFLGGDKGSYIDACNLRPNDMSGDNAALKKIKGETLLYSSSDSTNTFTKSVGAVAISSNQICIGAIEINNKLVEFWAYEPTNSTDYIDSQSKYPTIKVDGLIVAQSSSIPFTFDNLLQMDKNESCIGGEVYVTDNVNPPMFFNIKDMEENAGIYNSNDGSDKYFGSFDSDLYTISISNTVNAPRFLEYHTTNTGNYDATNGGNGLTVGTYAYAVRFIDSEGNRTEISEFTPTIPIYKNISSKTDIHPWAYTYGFDTSSETEYGLSISIRGNETKGFKSCEVIRVAWNAGDPVLLDSKPSAFIIARFDLEEDTIRSYNILDRSMDTIEAISDEEATLVTTSVSRAKAVRFFNNRLYFMNVSLDGKDVTNVSVGSGSNNQVNAYPVLSHMFLAGHNDPWHFAYRKQYMNSERYGFGVVFRDANGTRTFTTPLKFNQGTGVKDYFEFPSKRQPLSAESKNISFTGAMYGSSSTNVLDYTHDCYGSYLRKARTNRCAFIRFLENGSKCQKEVFGKNRSNQPDDEWATGGGCTPSNVLPDSQFTYVTAKNCTVYKPPYGILKPQQLGDINDANTGKGHHHNPHRRTWYSNNDYNLWQENYMFANDFYAMGLAIDKINPPSWASSFSIVRTKAAMRVLAEGLAWYSLDSAYKLKENTSKEKNICTFYSADFDTDNGLFSNLATNVEQSSSLEYKLVLQSPVGFNTEIYTNNRSGGKDEGADLISFAFMQKDQKSTGTKWYLPNDDSDMPISDSTFRYVAFGRWRNPSNHASTVWNNNKRTFSIKSFEYVAGSSEISGNRGGHYWKVELDDNLYQNSFGGSGLKHMQDDGTKRFHEPFYIASIIKENNEPSQGESTQYISTGHTQQMNSAFYLSKGVGFTEQLVDERWEDCITDIVWNNDGQYANGNRISGQTKNYHEYNKFVYVSEQGTGAEKRWLDITTKTNSEAAGILNEIKNNGYAEVLPDPSFTSTVKVYGVYSHKWSGQNYKNQKPSLVFDFTTIEDKGETASLYNKDIYIPSKGSIIYIKYDNRIPLSIYGGDSFSSESTVGWVDIEYGSNSKPKDLDLQLSIGMPQHKWEITPRNYIVNATSGTNEIQDENTATIGNTNSMRVRQWVLMYISHSRTPLHSQYMNPTSPNALEQFYPLVHHRPRPYNWKENDDIGDQRNVFEEYYNEVGEEDIYWGYGGFRYRSVVNQDYAAENTFHSYSSTPSAFEAKTDFCTRIVWSDIKPINVSDSPNLRSFGALNYFDLSDETGEIKYAYDTEGEKGNNLYAFTESGICLLVTDKRLLSQVSGSELAVIGSENQGVQKQVWIKKNIGMPDEMWRTAAESDQAIYWANKDTVYKLFNDSVLDIGRQNYYSRLNPELQEIKDEFETKITGAYNSKHKEYWLNIKCPSSEYDRIKFSPSLLLNQKGISLLDSTFTNGVTYPNNNTIGVSENDVLMLTTNDLNVFINFGGNSFNNLTPKNFKLCVAEGSEQITVHYNDNQTSEVIKPKTCKCVEPLVVEQASGGDGAA